MFQLRNLLNRSNIKSTPSDVNASEDFLHCVTVGHVVLAAMDFFEIPSMDAAAPASELLPQDMECLGPQEKCTILQNAIASFLKQFLNLQDSQDTVND